MPVVLGLADVLREFRQRQGISRRALSQKAGLSESYVGKLETGAIEPSLDAFLQVCRALNLTQYEVMFCVRVALAELSKENEED